MKFSHMSDCHLGSWNSHPDLREYPLKAFETAINRSITGKVDFILITGDLFDTSMPAVDVIKFTAEQLKRCKDAGIAVYIIAGSHDFSPTGKTMLSVLEAAGLVKNMHQKLITHGNVQIFGIEGLRGGLEKKTFEALQLPEMDNDKFKILMFHSAIHELCPLPMESLPIELLPKGFDYYATGHLHEIIEEQYDGGIIAFPGPLFQTNFPELEKFQHTGFYIVNAEKKNAKIEWQEMKISESLLIKVDGNGKTPLQIENEFLDNIEKHDINKKILLIKTSGRLKSGNPSDVNFKLITERGNAKGAISVKRSVHLTSQETAEAKTTETGVKEIETGLINSVAKAGDEKELILNLMDALKQERREDEKNLVYDDRIRKAGIQVLEL